jgi:hypothetical protein
MHRIHIALTSRLQQLRHTDDRGEFGPMAYAVMVSAMVVLALAVALWGEDIANEAMCRVEGIGGGADC